MRYTLCSEHEASALIVDEPFEQKKQVRNGDHDKKRGPELSGSIGAKIRVVFTRLLAFRMFELRKFLAFRIKFRRSKTLPLKPQPRNRPLSPIFTRDFEQVYASLFLRKVKSEKWTRPQIEPISAPSSLVHPFAVLPIGSSIEHLWLSR